MINIRHRLNDYLLRQGGHIGYSIRPTERKKGLGALQLSLGLQKCRELGMTRVLVTCDKSNPGSAGVIRSNGGVLENEVADHASGEMVQRYWISL
jgi:predicted acetyltransferase